MKRKTKMPSSYTILFLIIVVVAVLTWIVPAGEYVDNGNNSYSYVEAETNGQGVWQIINAPILGFKDAVDIALFVMVIGGFIGIVMSTGALDAGIARLLKVFKGKELYLIPILMVLFGLGGTTFGMAEETIAFYPLVIPVLIAAGFDVVTAVMVILFGAGVGVLGSTVNPFAIGAASEAAGVGIGDGIALRAILLIVVETIAIIYTMHYAKKVKKDITKSKTYDLHEEHVMYFSKRNSSDIKYQRGHGIILVLFSLTFIVMVVSVIPWEDFGVMIFKNLNDFLHDIPVIGQVFTGTTGSVELGIWWFEELSMLFLVSSVIIGIVAKITKVSNGDSIANFIQGSRDLLGVALIIGLSRGIKVVMEAGKMDATLLYYGSEALSNLGNMAFVILNYIFYIPMSFLIPSTSGLAGASMPIMGPLGEIVLGTSKGTELVITGYAAASGLVNLVTPTSGVIMGGLALAKIPYDRWVKIALPFMAIIFTATVIVLVLSTLLII